MVLNSIPNKIKKQIFYYKNHMDKIDKMKKYELVREMNFLGITFSSSFLAFMSKESLRDFFKKTIELIGECDD